MVIVGSRFIDVGFILMRVLGAIMRNIRGVSPHQHSEQDSLLELIGYQIFVLSFGFYLRDFCCPF
jgi:hypothetical protein